MTYLAVFVHLIVSEFNFFEGDDLFLELVAGVRGVRMGVEAVRRWWVCLACHQPRRPVIRVPVDRSVSVHYLYRTCVIPQGL